MTPDPMGTLGSPAEGNHAPSGQKLKDSSLVFLDKRRSFLKIDMVQATGSGKDQEFRQGHV